MGPGAGPTRNPAGFARARRLQNALDRGRIPIRLLRILGNGTNGVAVLCDAPDGVPVGGRRKRFVLKAEIHGQQTMATEKQHMMVCQGKLSRPAGLGSPEIQHSANVLVIFL